MFARGVPDLLGFRHSSERVLYPCTNNEEHCFKKGFGTDLVCKRFVEGYSCQCELLFMAAYDANSAQIVVNLLGIWGSERLALHTPFQERLLACTCLDCHWYLR